MQNSNTSALSKPSSASCMYQTAELASLLKAAGDELRLSVLQMLEHDSYGVLELAKAFSVKQSGISHHLKVLANAGLVCTRREGNSIFYRRVSIAPEDIFSDIKKAIFQQADQLGLAEHYKEGLRGVWQERQDASAQFFLENADKLKAQQDLIASFEAYAQPATELLDLTEFPEHARALEVGPGNGDFLSVLSERFKHVAALDNNEQMLKRANETAKQYTNIAYHLGDTQSLPAHEPYHCAVINMVLHHTPSPAKVLADVSKSLLPGGILVITELCQHQQAWARDACGDIWLGIAPTDLEDWAKAAQLELGQSTYLALRNGFQIQIKQFYKP